MERKGISQAQLAERIGVSQPTIFKLIHNNKTGSKHVHAVARALQTSPEYLTGETDDDSASAADLAFSQQDIAWIELLHGLGRREREAVLQLAETLSGSSSQQREFAEPIPVLQDKKLVFKGAE